MKYSKDFYVVAETLSKICKTQADYEKEHQIIYDVIIQDKNIGEQLIKRLKDSGFNVSLHQEEDSKRWFCRCIVEMKFNADDIIWIYEKIEEISSSCGGFLEGWSVL